MTKPSVLIFPDNVAVQVEQGTTLLEAARTAGIDLRSTCGGEGTCGRCAVLVKQGKVRVERYGNLSVKLQKAGYSLACQTVVEGNVVVEIPKDSRLDEHQVLMENKDILTEKQIDLEGYPFQPLCRQLELTLEPPNLTENTSDLNRLLLELKKHGGCEDPKISLPQLKTLAEALRQGNWKVTVTVAQINGCTDIIRIEPGHGLEPGLGIAVDIGTTTVVVYLIDLQTGATIDQRGTYNKQARYGDDVITRIIYATEEKNGMDIMHGAVINTVNELLEKLMEKNNVTPDQIDVAICAGNTTMTHLLLGISPKYIRLEPYIPTTTKVPPVKAREMGLKINPDAWVLNFPSIGSYVGGDIVSGALVTDMANRDELTLFIDIGTNGEMVLGNREWLVSCACSAGPAFEGGGITFGMRAMKGAIERVDIDPENFEVELKTIGDYKPIGICGSGLIDCLAKMRKVGIIDRAGKFQLDISCPRIRRTEETVEFVLAWGENTECGKDIAITENDVKNLLRSKGAVYAGIMSLVRMVEMDLNMIDKIMIAGGFGNYLNIRDAIELGLLPDLPQEKYEFIGNSSVKGARLALLSGAAWQEAQELARKMTYIELSVGNVFMDEFVSATFIPHTDLSLFPSVSAK